MNSKIVAAFLLVTISGVLAHPHHLARDDAVAAPVAVAQAAVPLSASSAAPEVTSAAPIPEEQPTSQALLDDATAQPVTLPAAQEGNVPAAESLSQAVVL